VAEQGRVAAPRLVSVKWLDKPDKHDYDAAQNYLSLLMPAPHANVLRRDLQTSGKIVNYKAKDILRASGLDLLARTNKHVAADLRKIAADEELSPILLIRGQWGKVPLVIADGYHRVCASYWVEENTDIPCMIV
jgi:hypothetical protein